MIFQSTHPVWGATPGGHHQKHRQCYFNPRTPCGVRHMISIALHCFHTEFQSTHPVWGATLRSLMVPGVAKFQSTHPVWGATFFAGGDPIKEAISIHAPRVGCDPAFPPQRLRRRYFNPRTPCGVRPQGQAHGRLTRWNFNPRTPCGVRPIKALLSRIDALISIHAPRVGCDGGGCVPTAVRCDFNPRTPCGVRHAVFTNCARA